MTSSGEAKHVRLTKTSEGVECPWCGERDFDLPGLKFHIASSYCEAFEACESPLSTLERVLADQEHITPSGLTALSNNEGN